MSHDPTIGGKLRQETSGVEVAGCIALLGLGPRKRYWSDLWIERHLEARKRPRIGVW